MFSRWRRWLFTFGGESAGMWVWTGPLQNLIDLVWVPAALRLGSLGGPRRCAALCEERPAAGVGGDPLHDAGQAVQTGIPLRLQAAWRQNQARQLLTEPARQLSKKKSQVPDRFLLFRLFDSFLICNTSVFNFPAFGFEIYPNRNCRMYLLNLKILISQSFSQETVDKWIKNDLYFSYRLKFVTNSCCHNFLFCLIDR